MAASKGRFSGSSGKSGFVWYILLFAGLGWERQAFSGYTRSLYGFKQKIEQCHWSDINGNSGQAASALDNRVGILIRPDNHLAARPPDVQDALDIKVISGQLSDKTNRDPPVILPHLVQRKIGNHPAVVDYADVIGNALHLRNV